MTSLADRTITALRDEHDALAAFGARLDQNQLTARSGAGDWTVAQVLSHLGSGAEIMLAGLQEALGDGDAPGDDFNKSVWDRWNAMSPVEQRAGFPKQNATLVEKFEAFSADDRESLQLPVGFLPNPLPVATLAGMRLNEVALHGWDARVAVDPGAGLRAGSAQVLAEHFADGLGFMLGFVGKPDQLPEPVVLDLAGSGFALSITDTVALTTAADAPTAIFTGPLEAALRMLEGRLGTPYTPAGVAVTGNVTLDELRRVFPGF